MRGTVGVVPDPFVVVGPRYGGRSTPGDVVGFLLRGKRGERDFDDFGAGVSGGVDVAVAVREYDGVFVCLCVGVIGADWHGTGV